VEKEGGREIAICCAYSYMYMHINMGTYMTVKGYKYPFKHMSIKTIKYIYISIERSRSKREEWEEKGT